MHDRLEKIKAHIEEHKVAYAALAGAVAATVIAVVVVKTKGTKVELPKLVVAPKQEVNIVQITLPERSCLSKPVMNLATREVHPSIHDAAKSANRSTTWVRDHIGDLYALLDDGSQI